MDWAEVVASARRVSDRMRARLDPGTHTDWRATLHRAEPRELVVRPVVGSGSADRCMTRGTDGGTHGGTLRATHRPVTPPTCFHRRRGLNDGWQHSSGVGGERALSVEQA